MDRYSDSHVAAEPRNAGRQSRTTRSRSTGMDAVAPGVHAQLSDARRTLVALAAGAGPELAARDVPFVDEVARGARDERESLVVLSQSQLGARERGDVAARALKFDQALFRIEDGGVGPFVPAGASVGQGHRMFEPEGRICRRGAIERLSQLVARVDGDELQPLTPSTSLSGHAEVATDRARWRRSGWYRAGCGTRNPSDCPRWRDSGRRSRTRRAPRA